MINSKECPKGHTMVEIFCRSRRYKGKVFYPKKGTHFRFFVCPICKGTKN